MVKKYSPLITVFIFALFFITTFMLRPQITFGESNGDCLSSGGSANDVCYTGDPGPNLFPGYACGNKSGYVYDSLKTASNIVHKCYSTPSPHFSTEDGVCCIPGTPIAALPPSGNYQLGGKCNANSICYTDGYSNPLHGEQCGTLKGWIYGKVGPNDERVPSCTAFGIGNGVCCDAGTPYVTPASQFPCPSQNGVCHSIDTALGNIDVSGPGPFIQRIFTILLSISGGAAMLLIIFSGYRMMAAQGDPEQLKGAREMLTSAIIGLLFIIFSVTILQIIGVDILHLPGFKK